MVAPVPNAMTERHDRTLDSPCAVRPAGQRHGRERAAHAARASPSGSAEGVGEAVSPQGRAGTAGNQTEHTVKEETLPISGIRTTQSSQHTTSMKPT